MALGQRLQIDQRFLPAGESEALSPPVSSEVDHLDLGSIDVDEVDAI